jgi:uncharacterized protein (DUF1800 family)
MAISRETIAAIRFGYGFHPDQTAPTGPDDLLQQVHDGLRAAPPDAGPTVRARTARLRAYAETDERNEGNALTAELRRQQAAIVDGLAWDRTESLRRAALSEYGFYERLVWFWRDHFTVTAKGRRGKLLVGRFGPDAIRPNVAGSFRDLLIAAETHPAMLHYLDQQDSMGPSSPGGLRRGRGLNENLAREILELHTLGVGAAYGQDDVRQLAELLTGLSVDFRTGEQLYRRNWAEPGPETVLGQRYGGGTPGFKDLRQVLGDLAAHPATAHHLARKLAVHFVADDPSDDLVAALEAAYADSGGDLMAVYTALLAHPESWDRFGAKIKQPVDFVVSSMRATGLPPGLADAFFALRGPLAVGPAMHRLNQPLFDAPGPDGWPEAAEAWITPPGLTARIDWASRLGQRLGPETDPRAFLATALADYAGPETTFAATRAAEKWEGVALVLASPEFNRR